MNCSQILPGAVNQGPCSLAVGYFSGNPFVVYASGKDVILLDGHLHHLQTIFGSTCGYGNTKVSSLHCAETTGRLVVAWGSEVVIFEPSIVEGLGGPEDKGQAAGVSREFPVEWRAVHTFSLTTPVTSICWKQDGSCLLTGGTSIAMWEYRTHVGMAPGDTESEGEEEGEGGDEEEEKGGVLREIWRSEVSSPVTHLAFSPNGRLFASCGDDDCLVKIWYPCHVGVTGIGTPPTHSFCYVAHPHSVRGFVWRRITPRLPRGCIPNVLLTHCTDNICRLWSHTLAHNKKGCLRFFIAASIDPVADIPFRTTMPLDDQPFIVHWLNNKETTLTSKVEKYQKGLSRPMSHYSSLQSFASSVNEEMLQSWVCIEEGEEEIEEAIPGTGSKSDVELASLARSPFSSSSRKSTTSYNFSNYLSPHSGDRPSSAGSKPPSPGGTARTKFSFEQKRALAHLLDEWCNTPDLLLCIHPTVGSLMVWTVEGLDAPPNLERLVHISFSSCLPHIFPPHLSQSLRQELLQFLIKEPDVLHTREASAEGVAGITDISLPVPQIRLSSGGSMSTMSHLEVAEDVRKIKSDSTLIIVSSHTNGSLNTWSVELTLQSNYCTSIAGLIHCAGTGGHSSKVDKIHRHPWLPILMTISSSQSTPQDGRSEVGDGGRGQTPSPGEVSELIIWNADLPGPLQHKSKLNELSRVVAPGVRSFDYMTWVPPISVGGVIEGALARCPCSGLFIANVGSKLTLFQASLYSITKPQPSSFMQSDKDKEQNNVLVPSSHWLHDIKVTSQLGTQGIGVVNVIASLLDFETIVDLYAFRMCSLITTLDLRKFLDSKFCRDVVLVLIENRRPSQDHAHHNQSTSSAGSKGTKSFVHLWRLTLCAKPLRPPSPLGTTATGGAGSSKHDILLDYTASVSKVLVESFPLPPGTCVVDSSPACDISSSLQLQTPTLSAPFLFSTSCSDGTIRCWQFRIKFKNGHDAVGLSPLAEHSAEDENCDDDGDDVDMEFNFYEVFDSNTKASDSILKPSPLDCYEEEVIRSLPTQSFVPSEFKVAYPGRLSMAHHLSKPIQSSLHRNSVSFERPSRTSIVKGSNPLDQYAMVTVWECESSGGLKWSCEANILLAGPAQIGARRRDMGVLMEWIPMENGAYLLATCFASIISIYGMSLPQDEEHFTVQRKRVGFIPRERTAVLNKVKSQASWVCLLQFPCFRPSLDQGITCLAYTGSNSIMLSIGSEVHLYSCWVQGENLVSFTPSERERNKLSKGPFSRTFIKDGTPSQSSGHLAETEVVNLLDYAHARNTPLPQYHPKILRELMNSGKLHAVKTILVNLVKFLLLYEAKQATEEGGARNYFDTDGVDGMDNEEVPKNLLTLSDEGYLHRSKYAKPKSYVDIIPHLPLAKMGIIDSKGVGGVSEEVELAEPSASTGDDYDELFSVGGVDDPKFCFDEEETEVELSFAELEPEKGEFTAKQAQTLNSILSDLQLADLSDLEQVQLLAIAETVASTKMSFSDVGDSPMASGTGVALSSLSGAGYATSGGTKGRDAMDACGLRYLLALESYTTLSQSLPEEMSPGPLQPSVLVWAFHSDAETELLSAIPCVQKDELRWEELRNAGVGWWLRNLDTLKRLIEKLAKAQFMRNQEPLDAGLFYLAMKKQSLLKGLFRSVADSKKAAFFSNNFAEDQWKNKAQKNAFVLLGKQRFEEAAAFFLLANKLWDAVEVCMSNLWDYQLAFVVIRLYEGDHGPIYQRFLKEYILGVPSSEGGPKRQRPRGVALECSPDPFLRSMVYWLLQDCSGALETLLMHPESATTSRGKTATPTSTPTTIQALNVFNTNPAIFNFYFYLRTHPLLVRRDNKMAASSFLSSQSHSASVSSEISGKGYLSGVGDEPLTAVERSLLFSTAYHHLCHGCPLLALNVLSHLPSTENLGRDICDSPPGGEGDRGQRNGKSPPKEAGDALTGMIESGTLSSNFTSDQTDGDDNFYWGAPVSDQGHRYGKLEEEEEMDWSKSLLHHSGSGLSGSEEIDWSQPFSSSRRFSVDSPTLSPPALSITSNNGDDGSVGESYCSTARSSPSSSSTLTTRGLFVLTLAGQLQYNACLSILTEELHSIYLPACCHFLWSSKGREGLPILPLTQQSVNSDLSLVQHYGKNALDRTVQNLRGMLVEWLRGETRMVKEVCRMEVGPVRQGAGVGGRERGRSGQSNSKPAGYDLLTTLMNYASLHAATSPSLLTVKFELMHLMNSLLPWSTGTAANPVATGNKDTPMRLNTSLEMVPTCAVSASQLPVLSSCTLPVKHLTNLATHLRLLSSCIVKVLTEHTFPPIASQPLPQVGKIFELCCAISHCITVSLNPTLLSDCSSDTSVQSRTGLTSSMGSLGHTPTPSSPLVDMLHHHQHPEAKTTGSPLLRQRMDSFSNLDSTLGTPNTKPAKWPGVSAWPQTLTSDEGRDPTPLSVVLVECVVSVYLGLLTTAWSQHSSKDLLVLLKNGPSMDIWYSTVGGGVVGKKADKVLSKNFVSQTLDSVSKKFRKTKRPSPAPNEEEGPLGVFVAPKKTLLDQFLSLPEEERGMERKRVRPEMGGFLMVEKEEEESSEEEGDEEDLDEETFNSDPITFTTGDSGGGAAADLVGGASSDTSPKNPNCFAWCLMNICISKILQQVMRKMVNGVGLELMELVTVSPLLYSTLKLLDEWESIFTRRLEALGEAPDDLFGSSDDTEPSRFRMGITLMRHKFILEPENSPFRSKDKASRNAKKLWQYLVHRDEARETIIHYIFVTKGIGRTSSPMGNMDTDEVDSLQEPSCKVIHKEHDNTVSAFCLNSCSRAQMTVLALALPREVMEIEVPDNSLLDTISSSSSEMATKYTPSRSMSLVPKNEGYIMVQSTTHLPRPKTSAFTSARRSIGSLPGLSGLASSPQIAHGQTGSSTSLLIRRPTAGVKRMAPHPSLAYYLTGSLDGSVTMWEFGTPRSVATQREPGMGGGVTKIRFTPEGNKFGVTDSSGKLSLWQGIQTSNKNAYHILHSCMKYLSDFLFLGSSSFIATCGDGIETRNLYLWDTLMPTNRSIVKEFTCHDGGATSLGYSLTRQRLFSGGKRGEICIFDIRQSSLLHCISVHNSTINCIVVNDIDGYFVTGASDGDIKVIDSSTLSELAHFPGQHSRTRLFRHGEGGVTDLDVVPGGKIYSCGADGSVKCQTLKL